jgi:hypothetical protein
MEPLSPLARHVANLDPDWKWQALFAVMPPAFTPEWQAWLAGAQQAEQAATLRYWATRRPAAA